MENIDELMKMVDEVENAMYQLTQERDEWKELYFKMKNNFDELANSVRTFLDTFDELESFDSVGKFFERAHKN